MRASVAGAAVGALALWTAGWGGWWRWRLGRAAAAASRDGVRYATRRDSREPRVPREPRESRAREELPPCAGVERVACELRRRVAVSEPPEVETREPRDADL